MTLQKSMDEYKKHPLIGSYKHAIPYARGNAYRAVRKHLGLSQVDMGRLIGCSWRAVQYRERSKRMYHMLELCILWQASGMSGNDFMLMLNDNA
jgi:DNA-binding XRE family transcriptional regulator